MNQKAMEWVFYTKNVAKNFEFEKAVDGEILNRINSE